MKKRKQIPTAALTNVQLHERRMQRFRRGRDWVIGIFSVGFMIAIAAGIMSEFFSDDSAGHRIAMLLLIAGVSTYIAATFGALILATLAGLEWVLHRTERREKRS